MLAMIRDHGIPSIVGWFALFRRSPLFAWRLLALRTQYTCTRTVRHALVDGAGFVIDNPDILISYWGLMVERELHHDEWVQDIMRNSCPYVIDLGANWGVFTHLIVSLNPNARITAVEPQAACVRRISDYARTFSSKVDVVRCAVGDSDGLGTLALTRCGDTGAHLIPQNGEDGDGHRFAVENVPISTLNSLSKAMPVDVLKVDVEGAEADVLRGGGGVLQRTRNLLVECHSEQNAQLVRHLLGNAWREIRLGPVDYLFVNDILKKAMRG